VARWRGLADLAGAAGFTVCLPWEGEADRHRAEAIARDRRQVRILPPMGLSQMGGLIAGAKAVVAVDTGLGHLSAALDVPSVSLYGPTGPERTGTAGRDQRHLALGYPCAPCRNKICNYTGNLRARSPCLAELAESRVWAELLEAAIDGGTDP
jgi:heptosyltransferase-1